MARLVADVGLPMTLPPFFGALADGVTEPDPIIWWFLTPPAAYLWAMWAAVILARLINTKPDTLKEGDSHA